MNKILVIGKYILKSNVKEHFEIVKNGAIYVENGRIVEIGRCDDLKRRYVQAETFGSLNHVVLPGFVNAHHHVGLTPFQLGAPDLPLELWYGVRYGARYVDPYLDTLYGAIEMIESGVTTVQHLHGRISGSISRVEEAARAVMRAYDDIGMRVSYSYSLRDQNRLAYEADDEFVARLPDQLGRAVGRHLKQQSIPLEDQLDFFKSFYGEHTDNHMAKVQLAPGNLHWCSDSALEKLAEYSAQFQVPMHMHLDETCYQKEYAQRRTGNSATTYLNRFGLLGPNMTIGHGTWLTEADIELIRESGTIICHNCSSNMRLASGTAPVLELRRNRVPVAIGLDEAGLNDDKDMIQEMRLVLRTHRIPGIDENVLSASDALRMATEFGARTTPFAGNIGLIAKGRAADLILLDWRGISEPYLDADAPVIDAILLRNTKSNLKTVIIDGKPVYHDGRFVTIDRAGIMNELSDFLKTPLSDEEVERREHARQLVAHLRQFYMDYAQGEKTPFYMMNSRS